MNNKKIIKNIGVSMLMKPVSMVLSLLYTPITLTFLGDVKYGIWVIDLNIISWINYFDIGIGNGLRNKLTEAVATGNDSDAQKYVSTAYVGTSIISLAFCILITLIWNIFHLSELFKLNLTDENINLVIFISVLFVCVNFILSLSKTSAYAIQQPGIISVVSVIGQVLQIVVILVMTRFLHESLIAVAFMYGIVSLFDSVLVFGIVTKKRPFLRPALRHAEKAYMKPLITLGIGFFAMQICTLVLNTTDNLLISNLYGSAEVTPYSLVYKVFSMFVQVHGIIIMPMWSAYTEAAVRKDMSWIRKTMKRVNFITLFLSLGAVVGMFQFEAFAKIWLGRELVYGKDLIGIMAIYVIAQMVANNYASFLNGVGHIKISVIVSVIGAVANIPLSIFFARELGMHLAGIILGSLCVMVVSAITLPIVSYRWLARKSSEWGKET